MTTLYQPVAKRNKEITQGSGIIAVLGLLGTILFEGTTMCIAVGGLWPIAVWALFIFIFLWMQA